MDSEQRLKRLIEEAGGRAPDPNQGCDITTWIALGVIAVVIVGWLVALVIGG